MGKLFKVPGGEYLVDSEDYEIRKDEFGRPILCPLNQGGGGDQPKLYAPEIKTTGDILTIIPNTDNGAFVTGYNGYMSVDGGDFELYGTLPSDQLELDLTAVGLPEGDFQFKATAIGTNFQESDASNVEDYTNIFYTITNTLTNCTSNNSVTSARKGSAYTATLTASAGYTMSGATVTVTMGGVDITDTAYANGVVTIAQLAGNLVVVASAAEDADLTWMDSTGLNDDSVSTITPCAFDGALYAFAAISGHKIYKTTNGKMWSELGLYAQNIHSGVVCYIASHGNRFIAFDNKFYYKECLDITQRASWETVEHYVSTTNIGSVETKYLFVHNGNWVVVGSNAFSNDYKCVVFSRGVNDSGAWTMYRPATQKQEFTCAQMNGKLFIFYTTGKFYYTEDGTTWTEKTYPYYYTPGGGNVYANGKYVLKGNGTQVFTSEDGLTWARKGQSSTTKMFDSVVYSDTNKYYSADGKNIAKSTDGETWNTAQINVNTQGLAQIGGTFVRLEHIGTSLKLKATYTE